MNSVTVNINFVNILIHIIYKHKLLDLNEDLQSTCIHGCKWNAFTRETIVKLMHVGDTPDLQAISMATYIIIMHEYTIKIIRSTSITEKNNI